MAVFLTPLLRSPLIRRGTQSGVYELDRQAPTRLRRQLDELQNQLRTLTVPASSSTADLSSIRSSRRSLTQEINKTEKALEEAEETLGRGRDTTDVAAAS
jgi:chromosome segregation ATPase